MTDHLFPMDRQQVVLRPYQLELVHRLRVAFAAGRKRLLCYAPTGAGKTELAMHMIGQAEAKGRRVLFIANRIELINQASRRFDAAGLDHGVIQGIHERTDRRKPIQICSIQTLNRRRPPEAELIIIDEAHGATASGYRKLLTAYNNLPTVGLSATPFSRGLGKHYPEMCGGLFEEIVSVVTARDLIKQGYLVDCEVYAPSAPDLEGIKVVRGDYDETALGEAANKPALVADIVSTWHRLANRVRTVCFAVNIPHSKAIVAQFRAAGITAEHIDCYTPDEERQAILTRLRAGETRVVCNVALLAEGFDLPDLGCMILARPTRSVIRYLQMVGRVLRPAPGKDRALILDHSGTVERLGFPTDDRPLELDDGTPRTAGERTGATKEPLPKPCPACQYVKPPRVHACPACGFKPERQSTVEVVPGELVKVERFSTADKERLYAELLGYAARKGYSPGWAYHKLKERVGTYPARKVKPIPPSEETLRWIQHCNIRYAKSREKQQGGRPHA